MKQEVVPKSDGDVFDYYINIRYIPHCHLEDAPVFKKYIETSVGADQCECLLRILGYCLSSLTKGRKAFVFFGIGRTGKSTVLNVLEAIIGGGLVSHEPFHVMSGERAKAHYEGKRVNISRETSTKLNRNEESFKSLISCEYTIRKGVHMKAKKLPSGNYRVQVVAGHDEITGKRIVPCLQQLSEYEVSAFHK